MDATISPDLDRSRRRQLPAPALPADLRLELDRQLLQIVPTDGAAVLRVIKAWLLLYEGMLKQQFVDAGHAEAAVRGRSQMMDVMLQALLDFAAAHLFRVANPTAAERLAVIAVGGYGRGELAPHSDIDLLFLHPYKRTPHAEQMIEFLLYKLWDLGLKVGQATRSIAETLRITKTDLAVTTSLLEARFLWGDRSLTEELLAEFRNQVLEVKASSFVEAKLAERSQRHKRMGDSRYMLEPNVKEGKGALRDLHTLFWLGRYLYQIEAPIDLVHHGVLPRQALDKFVKAQRFLWAVRCHLHYITGRAEDRLTFDIQPEIARRMGYRDRKSGSAVERFMKHYYLIAQEVGSLTLIFCAALEEKHRQRFLFRLERFGFGRRRVDDMIIHGGRIEPCEPDLFERDPVAMLRLFELAQQRQVDIHPEALRAVNQNLHRIARDLRGHPEANSLFLRMLTSPKDPAKTLRRMNEAGVLGRFIPEFGRVVALMEHSLYHVYTVDEHTIQAIGIVRQIESGELGGELPLATSLMPQINSRTELFLALFFHDLGKGRGGDHSVIGAGLVEQAGPRLGLASEQIDTVAWLVRHHLLLSQIAFKRDIDDPKTVTDLARTIQSPERLRLLLVLTVADIRAVGPGVWNGWKGQLLRSLYHETLAALAGGEAGSLRQTRIDRAKDALRTALGDWQKDWVETYLERHDPRYWTSFDAQAYRRHAHLVRLADDQRSRLIMDFVVDAFQSRTEMVLYAADHPGLFMKIAGALSLAGASIVDARIFTTADGMALDTFGLQNAEDREAVEDPRRLERIREYVERALAGEIWLDRALADRRAVPARTDIFSVEPRVMIDNNASRTHSVLEVNGRDRPGLLYDVTKMLKDLGLIISSAHISTYGERVVDVFYVKDVFGLKIRQSSKIAQVQRRLLDALAKPSPVMQRKRVPAGGD